MLALFNNLTEKDKCDAIERLIENSTPRQDFFLMVVLSVLMASFGLLINSSAVIIGSMLVAPILHPILSLSLGIVIADSKLISRSFYTLLKSLAFGISGAALVTLFFVSDFEVTPEIAARIEPSLIYACIAIVAGLAASFSLVKPQMSEAFPGIAISVALIPPLAVTGIGMAQLDWDIIRNSFLLFLINAIGIVFASMMVFSMMHLYIKRKVASETMAKEEENLKKEEEQKEKDF